jgi:hypothetical protein
MQKIYLVLYEIYSKEKKDFNINLEDEIIEKTLIKKINYGNRSVYI